MSSFRVVWNLRKLTHQQNPRPWEMAFRRTWSSYGPLYPFGGLSLYYQPIQSRPRAPASLPYAAYSCKVAAEARNARFAISCRHSNIKIVVKWCYRASDAANRSFDPRFCNTDSPTHSQRRGMRLTAPVYISHTLAAMLFQKPLRWQPLPFRPRENRALASSNTGCFYRHERALMLVDGTLAP